MPRPSSDDGVRVVQAVWDLFFPRGDWPTVGAVARLIDRRHDLALENALQEVPHELIFGIDPRGGVYDQQIIGLTVAGAAVAQGSSEELEAFLAAVRLAADLDRAWVPPPNEPEADPILTVDALVKSVQLPASGRPALLARVRALLLAEPWGWNNGGGPSPDGWSFTISRKVRRFRDVTDVADYWARARGSTPEEHVAPNNTAPQRARSGRPLEMTMPTPNASERSLGRVVFLVHGRDHEVRDALIDLLRELDLRVLSWREAATHAGGGTPYTGDIVRAGMDLADAVLVLLTPDDIGCVRPQHRQDRDGYDELRPTGQARLNVIFEAGMALALDRNRVVLVEVGATRALSDTAGLNIIRLRDNIESRKDLVARLRAANLAADTEGERWRTVGQFDRQEIPSHAPILLTPEVSAEAAATDA